MKVQIDLAASDVVSESAPRKKLPAMITPTINRVRTVIIASSSKPAVQAAANSTKEVKKLVKSASTEYAASLKLRKQVLAEDKKKVPDFKKMQQMEKDATKHLKAAQKIRKQIDRVLKQGQATLKKAGLSRLYIPIAHEHLTGLQKTPEKVAKAVQAVKANTFGTAFAKRRISYITPKFVPDARFETLAQAQADKEAGKKPAAKAATKPAKKSSALKVPTNKAAHDKLIASYKTAEKGMTKSLKSAMGVEKLTKADIKKMSYSYGAQGSMQLIDKDGKKYNFSSDKLKKNGLDRDMLGELMEINNAHQHNISAKNPDYGSKTKAKATRTTAIKGASSPATRRAKKAQSLEKLSKKK